VLIGLVQIISEEAYYMKHQIIRLTGLLSVLVMALITTAGTWSANNFFYQPGLGARGAEEKNYFDAGLNRVDAHLSKYKTLGDPGYATLSEALATIGTETKVTLTIPAGTVPITSNTTIPGNVALKILKNGTFNINSGISLTIEGPLEAGMYQIFSGSGTVVFGNGAAPNVFPEWWGAKGDGNINDYGALNAAVMAASGKGAVYINPGKTFMIGALLELPSNTTIVGHGTIRSMALSGSGWQGLLYATSGKSNIKIHGVTIDANDGGDTTHSGLWCLYLTSCTDVEVKNSRLICHYAGIYVGGSGAARVVINDNHFDHDNFGAANTPGPGIVCQASDAHIEGNRLCLHDMGAQANYGNCYGIAIGTSAQGSGPWYRGVVSNNKIYRGYTGIAGGCYEDLTVSGNVVSNQKTQTNSQGIYLNFLKGASITGNSTHNVDYTHIAVMDSEDVSVTGNSCKNDVEGTNSRYSAGIVVSTKDVLCQRVVVVGNSISGIYNETGSSTDEGLLVKADDCLVSDNSINCLDGTTYGIYVQGNGNLIENNKVKCSGVGMYFPPVAMSGNVTSNNMMDPGNQYAIWDRSTTGPNVHKNNILISGNLTLANEIHYVLNTSHGKPYTVAKTANGDIEAYDQDKRITNAGASDTVTFTLPAATQGMRMNFIRIAGYALRIDPDGSEVIRGGGAGKYLSLDSNGASVTLECVTDGTWEIVSSTGTACFEP
jgi:hypothetical protein